MLQTFFDKEIGLNFKFFQIPRFNKLNNKRNLFSLVGYCWIYLAIVALTLFTRKLEQKVFELCCEIGDKKGWI